MNIRTLLSLAGLFLMSSCGQSFLELVPQTSVSAASFFISEDDYRKAVTGAYKPLETLYNYAYVMGEMRADNTYYLYNVGNRGGQIVERENIATFTDVATNAFVYAKYTACYDGVAKTNAVLQRIDAASISASARDNLKGQAAFLRAFYYFELVQYFGGVPLHLKEVSTVAEASLPRSSAEEVYKQIIADATEAANLLPDTQSPKGQATKGSAKMLLAYVYMTLKQYPDAEKELRDITGLGYSLLANYASIFDPAAKNNAESIFEVQYLEGPNGLQSNFAYQFAPGVTDTKNITGQTGNSQNIGDWNIPTDELIAAYEPGDSRKAASIADGYINPAGVYVKQPFVIKYLHPHSLFNNTNDNWPVYRYSDALLLLAECLNEQNKSGDAVPYLNQVRIRAGLQATTATSQSSLRDAVAKERRIELAFENHRWLDLVRTGQAVAVLNTYGARQKLIRPYLSANTYNVTTDRLIFPIPLNELLINSLLTQNHGY